MGIKEYLSSLGSTPDEVAASLEKQGIKGIRKSQCLCPILNAIYKACPNYWSGLRIVGGSKRGEHWSYWATLDDCQIMDPVLPQPVMDFIGIFDEGGYEHLAAKKVSVKTVRTWE
jgi:hypothetical protein